VFNAKTMGIVGAITLPKPVFTADFDNKGSTFAVGSADGQVRVLNMPKNIVRGY